MEGVEAGVSNVIRIFVGGLGATVTESDLRKTFSSLGTIKGVEVIRTNGRSFAYMDFLPSSEKCLGKLFSKYSGCVWKGGRLRLEKAKEHYLVRLRREWAEDAEVKTTDNALDLDTKLASSGKSNRMFEEKAELRIFFPRLRKVKLLPYSGTGKHKYSFQRIDVPSLPLHFCDCEEHCTASETTVGKHILVETQIGGINNEELNIMNSVMNKLFKKEDHEKAVGSGITSAMDGDKHFLKEDQEEVVDSVITSTMDQNNSEYLTYGSSDERESVEAADEDGMVTNIVMGRNGPKRSMYAHKLGTASADQDSTYGKMKASNSESPANKRKARARNRDGPANVSKHTKESAAEFITNKKARPPPPLPASESSKDEQAVPKPGKEGIPEVHPKESECSAEDQPADIHQPNKGLSWVQKSSWKQLVGETGNSGFSITNILPDIVAKKLEKSSDLNISSMPTGFKGQKSVNQGRNLSSGYGSKLLEDGKLDGLHKSNVVTSEKQEKIQAGLEGQQNVQEKNLWNAGDVFGKQPEKKDKSVMKKPTPSVTIGEVCSFMRNANSEREWTKAKTAVSGLLKRKSNERNPSKNSKGSSNSDF